MSKTQFRHVSKRDIDIMRRSIVEFSNRPRFAALRELIAAEISVESESVTVIATSFPDDGDEFFTLVTRSTVFEVGLEANGKICSPFVSTEVRAFVNDAKHSKLTRERVKAAVFILGQF
jgi:hypothetical protein